MLSERNRISVRGVNINELSKLRRMAEVTRLPQGALLEDCINLLWGEYVEEGLVADDEIPILTDTYNPNGQ